MLFKSQNTPNTSIRYSLGLFFVIFLVIGGLIALGMIVFYRSEVRTHLSNLKIQETYGIELQSLFIEDTLDSIIADLLFVSQQNELKEYLTNKKSDSLDKIALEYIVAAKQKKIYDQIRFIDKSGLEIVRVNYNQGFPAKVAKDKLQWKQHRYYFKDTYALEKGAIFMSPFDLNIDNGTIEQPFKPMIRFGTPVFDSFNQKRGVVMINYLGKTIFNKILESESVSVGQTMLLNSDGYWLFSPTPNQAWGFMFNDKQQVFGNLHPEIWQEIRVKENGQITNVEGLFTFKTIYPFKKGSPVRTTGFRKTIYENEAANPHNLYRWHLVSLVPSESLNSYSQKLRMKSLAFGAGILLFVAAGSWIIALGVTKRHIYQAQLKEMALYDPLTELPNRRLFFDRLSMILEVSRRNKQMFGIVYMDLDGFKNVNDSLGHEAGDELLCKIAQLLNVTFRKSDTIARLGGDEFAIIIGELDSAKEAETVAEKLLSTLAKSNQFTAGNVNVGASIGISLFPVDSDEAEELVRLADKSMYISKRKGKNTYTLSCSDTNIIQ